MEAEDGAPEGAPALPELEGYLSKLKHKTALVGGWTRRYFRTDGASASLVYYASEGAARGRAAAPSGAIRLADVLAVREFDDTQFQVVTGRRTFFLRAESPAEQSCWCARARAPRVRWEAREPAAPPRRHRALRRRSEKRARAAANARANQVQGPPRVRRQDERARREARVSLFCRAADAPAQSLTPGSFKRRRVLANAGREYSRQAEAASATRSSGRP